MLHPYVQHWFDEHPNHNECYEVATDATFHATKAAADAWCAKFANKKVIQHLRPEVNNSLELEEAAQKAAEEAAQKAAEETAQDETVAGSDKSKKKN